MYVTETAQVLPGLLAIAGDGAGARTPADNHHRGGRQIFGVNRWRAASHWSSLGDPRVRGPWTGYAAGVARIDQKLSRFEVIVSYMIVKHPAARQRVAAFSGLERSARLKLDRLEAAVFLDDLATLPNNRFEAHGGDPNGPYSIRIDDEWRICFEWAEGAPGPSNVAIIDYH
jgi:toxin HigB-1